MRWRRYAMIAAGVAVMCGAYQLFLVPNRIAPGGFTGLAMIAHYKLGWPIGVFVIALNAPLFAVAMRKLNLEFAALSLAAMLGLSVALDLVPAMAVTEDLLLAGVYGGLALGLGQGMVLLAGATTGGSDMCAKLIQGAMPHVSMGRVLLAVDFAVVALSAVAFDAQMALYALVALFIASRVVDMMQEGLSSAKAFFCVTERAREVAARVLTEMKRGVTALQGIGAFSGQSRNVLFCVVDRRQVAEFKRIVMQEDSNAFLVVTDVREVMGEGFGGRSQKVSRR